MLFAPLDRAWGQSEYTFVVAKDVPEAYQTVKSAVDYAVSQGFVPFELWINANTYPEDPITLPDGSIVRGGIVAVVPDPGGPFGMPEFTFFDFPCSATITGSGAGPIFTCAGSATIRGLTLTGNAISGSGAGIHSGGGHLDVSGCCFEGLSASGGGGGIHKSAGTLQVTNCHFTGNHALGGSLGGAIRAVNITGRIEVSEFSSNDAGAGGACAFDNCDINYVSNHVNRLNKAFGGDGGCIFATRNRMTIDDCVFEENRADGDGGAVCMRNVQSARLLTSKFQVKNMSVQGRGGALAVADASNVEAEGCEFDGNIADLGAGIAVSGQSQFTMTGGFVRNHIESSTGAGCVIDFSVAEFKTVDFERNEARSSGGAIYAANGSILELNGSNFRHNRAKGDGGALLLQNAPLLAAGGAFEDNHADKGNGGAVSAISPLIRIDGVQFIKNAAQGAGQGSRGRGGALFLSACANVTLLNETTLKENSATGSGGGIYAERSTLRGKTRFEDNTSLKHGGGILATQETTVTLEAGSVFEHNIALSGLGGGICVQEFTRVDCRGGGGAVGIVFDRNTSSQGGAAFVSDLGAVLRLRDRISLTKNEAPKGGGGITVWMLGTLDIDGGEGKTILFDQNISTAEGSAVFANGAHPPIALAARNVKFSSNTGFQFAGRELARALAGPNKLERSDFRGTNAVWLIDKARNRGNVLFDRLDIDGEFAHGVLGFKPAFEMANSEIKAVTTAGMYLHASDVLVQYCLFRTQAPVQFNLVESSFQSHGKATLERTVFDGALSPVGIRAGFASSIAVRKCSIAGHSQYGAWVDISAGVQPPTSLIDARQNWWGKATGPLVIPYPNPQFYGDKVSPGVLYDPWETEVPDPIGPQEP
ncbi:MAG: hypothetical protein HYY93_13015 [Planctomycetes bacterium]|nr:hypothetical protein [Planctomycetota bacterium]